MPKNSEDLYETDTRCHEQGIFGLVGKTNRDNLVHHEKIHGGGGCASKDYIGMYGMQAAQLQHDEGKEESSGQNGNQEILQVLQVTHVTQGN